MTSKKRTVTLFILIMIAAAVVLSGILFYKNSFVGRAAFRKDLKRLSEESYDSIFLSMHSSSGFTPDIFETYFVLNTVISSYEIQSMGELQCYMDEAFSSDNTINKVFLLLDPDMIWNSCRHDEARWDDALQNGLLSYISAHPDTDFEILLPHPCLSYWLSMSQDDMNDILDVYHHFIEEIYIYANIRICYTGFENWLLVNSDSFISDFDANDEIARRAFLVCFQNNQHQITPENDQLFFNILREQVASERISPTVYPNLTDCCLVFFGDSIIAYGTDTITIPEYVTALSHAATYNYAVGGTAASIGVSDTEDLSETDDPPGINDFPNLLPRFLSEYCTAKDETFRFSPEGTDMSDKKLCVIISYGVNDYFRGAALENPDDPYDTATYTGGLRTCISQCQSHFPDAEFIIMTPVFTNRFSNGTERKSDVGGVLTDYVDAAAEVAAEMDIHCIDNYHSLGIDESNVWDYTSDGCHLNENGRILMARQIIDYIDSLQ